MTAIEPIQCVACGQEHIQTEEDLRAATRIGISFVARQCQWTMKYPGMAAHEVIAQLESRLVGTGGREERPGPPLLDSASVEHDEVDDGDPAGREADPALTGGHRVPCAVCHGDGELMGVEGDDVAVVPCARCGGDGTVVVTG